MALVNQPNTFTATQTINPSSGILPLVLKVQDDDFIDFENIAGGGNVAPIIWFHATNGSWQQGIDISAPTPYRDLVLAVKSDYPNPGNANDFIYCSHNGTDDPTVGIGKSQPGTDYRMWVVGWTVTSKPEMGTLKVQAGSGQTGNVLALTNWGGTDRMWVAPETINTWVLRMRGDSTTTNPNLVIQDSTSDAEKLALRADGSIRFVGDNNANLYQPFASTIKASQNFVTGNFLGVGPGITATPTATIDVAQTGANNASLYLRTASNGNLKITAQAASAAVDIASQNASALRFGTSGATKVTIPAQGGLVIGTAALATTATDGFVYLPTCVGAPTGTPTAQTGTVAAVYDTTDNKLYVYNGAWKGVVLS